MSDLHKGLSSVAGFLVTRTEDYSKGLNGLPKSDVLKFFYEGSAEDGSSVNGSFVIRPSGTEPKIKAYLSVTASDEAKAREIEEKIAAEIEGRL